MHPIQLCVNFCFCPQLAPKLTWGMFCKYLRGDDACLFVIFHTFLSTFVTLMLKGITNIVEDSCYAFK